MGGSASTFKRHTFVVMPFGVKEVPKKPRTEVPPTSVASSVEASEATLKVDFNEVYEKLLKPALVIAGCEPFRADEETSAGDIRKDMFFELVTADLVLADISILNANVFYELGIRHGIAPRGVISVHAGWSDRPFDVAPDRTFKYDGTLFNPGFARDQTWQTRLEGEVKRLAGVLRGAIQFDNQTVGSPVYSALEGIKPVEWTDIKTDRAKYFRALSEDWRQRVKVARKERHPGDILTLAGDMPTRLHRRQLLWQCARALVELHRFEQARHILEDMLELDREDFEAQCYMALVDNRLGRSATAEESLASLADKRPGDGEAQGMLGRVYKDLWRVSWKNLPSLEERQTAALENAVCAARAIGSYDRAFRRDLGNYYNGINVATLQSLLIFLAEKTGDPQPETGVTDLADLLYVIGVGAKAALRRGEVTWAAPTLGELELLRGNGQEALVYYQQAANAPGVPYFEVDSMLGQLRFFGLLGFQAEPAARIIALLEKRLSQLGPPHPVFEKVFIFSGHMIDAPGRAKERFPARKAALVSAQIANRLDQWGIGKGDLAICGGARGGDILFAEECQRRGAHVRLLFALPRDEFIAQSVRLPESDWVQRFNKLTTSCEVAYQHERLGDPPQGLDVFSRCNLWIINTARVEFDPQKGLFALLVWDEKPTGDGPGGTSDFAARVQGLGGEIAIINPTTL